MKRIRIGRCPVFLMACLLVATCLLHGQEKDGEALTFVLSTDLSSDVDDAAAVGFLLEAVQRGKGQLGACVTDGPTEYASPALRAMLDAWGMDEVPVGAYQGSEGDAKEGPYAKGVAEAFGQKGRTRKDFEDDVTVLRKVYASVEEHSIVFIAIGYLNCLDGLMRSKPDEVSPLSGAALFEQKTAYVVSVGQNYLGNSEGVPRWNWKHAHDAAAHVINHMTRPFFWLPANEIDQSGFPKSDPRAGAPDALTGPERLGWNALGNPIQRAFELARLNHPGLLADGLRRKAFDPLAVRFATERDGNLFGYYLRGVHLESREGRVFLDPKRQGQFHILKLKMPTANHEVRDYLDGILGNLKKAGKE